MPKRQRKAGMGGGRGKKGGRLKKRQGWGGRRRRRKRRRRRRRKGRPRRRKRIKGLDGRSHGVKDTARVNSFAMASLSFRFKKKFLR